MKINRLFSRVALLSILTTSSCVYAVDAVTTMSPQQQKQVEAVVHNYLVKNPEVIVESMQTLQQKQMDQARKSVQKTQENAPKFANDLFHQTADPDTGNANGKLVLVDFFDYQCPHCTTMTPVLEALTASNGELRVVFKEFPIRGQLSEFASRAALAAKMQGKYFEFHKALMDLSTNQKFSEATILDAAKTVGLNVDKLKADMKSEAISQQLKNNFKLGQNLQLMGTPAFFIAKSTVTTSSKPDAIVFVPGQVDKDQLKIILEKINK